MERGGQRLIPVRWQDQSALRDLALMSHHEFPFLLKQEVSRIKDQQSPPLPEPPSTPFFHHAFIYQVPTM